ncbi:c-type cytochrome [Paraburkholderia sp. RP-4-7]|uniref:C-type cytochrome n=2 Tax=Paraburkholderia polaris TaxID=2728848 RepID=A0A848I659_9BURK|nr:cytochrome c [Paraburkholderia polaris]NML97831.1 c-type cytochrome [Paraburkholderia polaris]
MNQNDDDIVAVRDDERGPEPARALSVERETSGPALHRSEHYQWPMRTQTGDAAAVAYADLMVEAGHERDGTMTTWQYRASMERKEASSLDDHVPPGAPLLVYRHAQASVAVEASAAQTIPAQAHAFARESFIDELAHALQRDPVALRLQHLDAQRDGGARETIRMVTERAAWGRPLAAPLEPASPWVRGRGFAFDGEGLEQSVPRSSDPTGSLPVHVAMGAPNSNADSWTAWVVDVDVNRETGDVTIRRVVAGRGTGEPGAAQMSGLPSWQVADAIERSTGVRFLARSAHDETGSANDDAVVSHELSAASKALSESSTDTARVLTSEEVDKIERAAAPAAAAIANALFDATGVRFRAPPFDAERIRRALADTPSATLAAAPAALRRPSRWRRWTAGGGIGGVIGGLIGLACSVLPGPAPIAPIASIDTSLWSPATLERGRQIAAAGDCAVCHTAPGGKTNAGGFALDTPFGTVYSTNLTPDAQTGIGTWSYEAFARAMREGVSRDGSHLYPAFPYTAFAKMSEPDMMALYAYLMSQAPVKNAPPKTNLPFPLNQRRLVAGWNWLFHDTRPFVPDETRSAQWNRGKYLVDGAGHCGACHTPRNAIGAEKGGFAYLSGGNAEGWDAPSLVASRAAPVPWSEAALFDYLRTGFSAEHGVAAGPMAPVVAGLSTLPESDVRAIAHYVASLSPPVDAEVSARAAAAHASASDAGATTTLGFENGRRIFETSCAVCHAESGGVGHFGVRPLMGLNTSVAQATPDNLLRVLQHGIDQPATDALGYMPGFRDVLDDKQMAELASYIRVRYAPGQAAWRDLESTSARLRAQAH